MSRAKDFHCQQCGALTEHPGEFHPYLFCLIKKADPMCVPWDRFRDTAAALGVDLPEKPPLVRDLPGKVSS